MAVVTELCAAASGLPDYRKRSRIRFAEILGVAAGSDDGAEQAAHVAVALENAVYTLFALDNKEYLAKLRSLAFNLRDNKELAVQVLDGEIAAPVVAQMDASELASAASRQQAEALKQRAAEACRGDWMSATEDERLASLGLQAEKGMFPCGKCKSDRVSHTQMQTRSADEPMTLFLKCKDCGNRWKR